MASGHPLMIQMQTQSLSYKITNLKFGHNHKTMYYHNLCQEKNGVDEYNKSKMHQQWINAKTYLNLTAISNLKPIGMINFCHSQIANTTSSAGVHKSKAVVHKPSDLCL